MKSTSAFLFSAVFIALISITSFSGCDKKDALPQTCSNGIKDADETGVDCGGSCAACAACSTYLPLKVGNKWIYKEDTYNTFLGALKITKDTLIDGNSYFKVVRTDTLNGYYEGALYVRNSNGNIFEISADPFDLFQGGFIGGPYGVEFLLLKENAGVGESWTAATGVTRSIVEKDITLVVLGRTYTDVVRVRQVKGGNTVDFWYSKCVGLIKSSNDNLLSIYEVN